MYNIGARYKIVGRVTNGTSVLAYVVADGIEKKNKIIPKNIVEQLALSKQIYNCTGQVYGNIVNLKGINCKLNQLPRYNMNGERVGTAESAKNIAKKNKADLKIVAKVQNGRVISAYIVKRLDVEDDRGTKISRQEILNLARSGRIINAKCQKNENTYMLRAAPGYTLSNLPVVND